MNHVHHAHRRLRLQTTLIVVIALLLPLAAQLPARRVLAQEDLADISAEIAASGSARVIVSYDVPTELEPRLSAVEVRAQRSRIAQAQDLVARRLLGTGAGEQRRLSMVPASAYVVDAAALARLQADPLVASIEPDRLLKPLMYGSNPIIGSPTLWSAGITGSGQTVAVLDTGVDKTHPFLSGQVVSEACYSAVGTIQYTDASYVTHYVTSTTLCPGGVQSSTAAGSGLDCSTSISGCGHGTHVAGTIAGKPVTVTDGTSNYNIRGVAPDASIIAIKVFTRFPADTPGSDDSPCGATACALSFQSDQMAALQRVYNLRNTYDIAAVNMSLGGGRYYSSCDSASSSYTTLVNNLTAAGIAVVIASGNDGFSDSVGFPACISNAVTVASTASIDDYLSPPPPPVDSISDFSNVSAQVDLYAPGQWILSSSGGAYDWKQGTSMATPHVAGAFALLGQAAPEAGVSTLLSALKDTGEPIVGANTSGRSSVPTIPRIQVDAAVESMAKPPVAGSLSGRPGSLGISWLSGSNLNHDVKIERLAVGSASWTTMATISGTTGISETMYYTDTSDLPACAYRLSNQISASLSSSTTLMTNTVVPATMLSSDDGKMGSTFSAFGCGLPASQPVLVSINGFAPITTTTDAAGWLMVNFATTAGAAFGRYDVTFDLSGHDNDFYLSFTLASNLTLRSAGTQGFYPVPLEFTVDESITPLVHYQYLPHGFR